MSTDRSGSRLAYIDWARGIAVLLMIEAHTFDAWTRASSRMGRPFAYSAILGGFAAPLFLWLAGLGAAMSAASVSRRAGDKKAAVQRVCSRGLEIFILAFLFRIQSFVITPGSYPVTLFRVDILNAMGPAIIAIGLLWALSPRPAVLVVIYSSLACLVAMSAPLVRTWGFVDTLPTWIQWYLRPSGDYTTFTLVPWIGFAFSGAACGALLAESREAIGDRRLHLGFAAVGAAVVGLGFFTASQPSIYPQSSFWTSSPAFFAIRVGLVTMAFAALFAVWKIDACRRLRLATVVEQFGKSSLFVYWIHVELVYGYATWPLRHRLPLWGTAIACAAFMSMMYGAVAGRDRLAAAWRARRVYDEPQNVAV